MQADALTSTQHTAHMQTQRTSKLQQHLQTSPHICLCGNRQNKLPFHQLVLLNSISDEKLTQTIGVICSSVGDGGLGLHHSHECSEFISPGSQMVSGCLSQVQVHVQEMHIQRVRHRPAKTDSLC